ncbi:unnamed protein product [Brassica oleracea]
MIEGWGNMRKLYICLKIVNYVLNHSYLDFRSNMLLYLARYGIVTFNYCIFGCHPSCNTSWLQLKRYK